jgi:hypothetical protein
MKHNSSASTVGDCFGSGACGPGAPGADVTLASFNKTIASFCADRKASRDEARAKGGSDGRGKGAHKPKPADVPGGTPPPLPIGGSRPPLPPLGPPAASPGAGPAPPSVGLAPGSSAPPMVRRRWQKRQVELEMEG